MEFKSGTLRSILLLQYEGSCEQAKCSASMHQYMMRTGIDFQLGYLNVQTFVLTGGCAACSRLDIGGTS